ncbi:MAG: serine/threonine protein kinase [Candidatus Obscuribacterales bacterium]
MGSPGDEKWKRPELRLGAEPEPERDPDYGPDSEEIEEDPFRQYGLRLDENYEFMALLGEGGMGRVFKVRDRSLGKHFAVKAIRPELLEDKATLKRFESEATGAVGLSHPNLVSVYGMKVTEDGKQPYLLMDYYAGKSLADLLSLEVKLDQSRALGIFIQICDAVQYAHDQKVVHRDLKPGNILLVKEDGVSDFVKVLDFGIARFLFKNASGATTQGLTQDQQILGSPEYMSPEQCRGEKPDNRSDIYSLGCVMYESLSGAPPFRTDNPIKTLLCHVNNEPLPFAPALGVGRDLLAVVLKCLEKDPDHRYQSMTELKEDLELILAGSRPRRAGKARIKRGFKTGFKAGITPAARNRLRKVLVVFGAVAVGFGVLAVAYTGLSSRPAPDGEPEPVDSTRLTWSLPPADMNDLDSMIAFLERAAVESGERGGAVDISEAQLELRAAEAKRLAEEMVGVIASRGPKVIPTMLKHVDSDYELVRHAAAAALIRLNSYSAGPLCDLVLSTKRGGQYRRAAETLSLLGKPGADELVGRLPGDNDAANFKIMNNLTLLLIRSGTASTLDARSASKLVAFLETGNDAPSRRLAALALAAPARNNQAFREALMRVASSATDTNVRTACLSSLGVVADTDPDRIMPFVAGIMQSDSDAFVRYAACINLIATGRIGEGEMAAMSGVSMDRDNPILAMAARTALALGQDPVSEGGLRNPLPFSQRVNLSADPGDLQDLIKQAPAWLLSVPESEGATLREPEMAGFLTSLLMSRGFSDRTDLPFEEVLSKLRMIGYQATPSTSWILYRALTSPAEERGEIVEALGDLAGTRVF